MPTPIGQLLSRTIYAADGVTTTWNFSFSGGYLDKAHVKAVTETPDGARTDITITSGMFTGPNTLLITPAIAAGRNLIIYRDTPKDLPLVNFADEAGFSEIALDTNAKQAVFIAAETTDTVNTGTSYEAEQAANAAAASAAAAAASYDAFDDRYLGAKSANPTTDNDGNALLVGALYWNTVANGMRSYTGTSWEDITGVLAQVPATYSFNGTGAQVAFTLPTAPTSSKLVTVRVGGVFQEDSTYSVAGAVITFSEAPPVGTGNVDVIVYTPATSGDASSITYTPAGTGAVATTVQGKLRQKTSVFDFIPVNLQPLITAGTNTTDLSPYLQAALDEIDGTVTFPPGTYKYLTTLNPRAGQKIKGQGNANLHAWGVDGFTIAAGISGVTIKGLNMFSYSAVGVADPRLYVAVYSAGVSGNQNNRIFTKDLYLQGWAAGVYWRYTWTSRANNVSTVNTNNGVLLFGQSVNNSISECSLVANSGNSSIKLLPDGSTVGEGLSVSDSLLSSGTYGIDGGTGFLALQVDNCTIDLIQDTGIYGADFRSSNFIGNWIYATNKGINYVALASAVDVDSTISGNNITVTSSTGTGVSIGALNKGVTVTGGSITINGTSRGVYVDGTECLVSGIHFNNSGSGSSVYFNATTGNKLGACTGDFTVTGIIPLDMSVGSWTPTDGSGAGLAITASGPCSYTKIGNVVTIQFDITYPATADVSTAAITLPFTSSTAWGTGNVGYHTSGVGVPIFTLSPPSLTRLQFSNGQTTIYTNAQLTGARMVGSMTYLTNV